MTSAKRLRRRRKSFSHSGSSYSLHKTLLTLPGCVFNLRKSWVGLSESSNNINKQQQTIILTIILTKTLWINAKSSIFKWGNWGSKKWNNLPKIMQVVSNGARISPRSSDAWSLYTLNTGLLLPYACQNECTLSARMCSTMTRRRLDNIWNYFRMEKSIIWNLKKKYILT